MADYLKYNVKKESGLIGKNQTPQVEPSKSLLNFWEGWTFK